MLSYKCHKCTVWHHRECVCIWCSLAIQCNWNRWWVNRFTSAEQPAVKRQHAEIMVGDRRCTTSQQRVRSCTEVLVSRCAGAREAAVCFRSVIGRERENRMTKSGQFSCVRAYIFQCLRQMQLCITTTIVVLQLTGATSTTNRTAPGIMQVNFSQMEAKVLLQRTCTRVPNLNDYIDIVMLSDISLRISSCRFSWLNRIVNMMHRTQSCTYTALQTVNVWQLNSAKTSLTSLCTSSQQHMKIIAPRSNTGRLHAYLETF